MTTDKGPGEFPGTPEEAADLLETILSPDFLSFVCDCGKPVNQHTDAEVRECLRRDYADDH